MIDRPDPSTPAVNDRANGEVSLLDISTMLLRHRRLLFALPLYLAVAVGVWNLLQTRMYTAYASFMSTGAETSGAASLARQFGINIESDAPTQSPQFYADLMRSSALLGRALDSKYSVRGNGATRQTTLLEYLQAEKPGNNLSRLKAIEKLRDRVNTSVIRSTGVVQVSVSARQPMLAEQITAQLLRLVNEFILETRQAEAEEEGRFVGLRMDKARTDLLASENALQRFLQRNRQFTNAPELVFEHDRLQRQIEMRQEVYTALAQSYERARLNAARNTRTITVIDSAQGTAKPEARGTVKRVFLALFLGLLGGLMVSVARDYSNRGRLEQVHKYREFEELKRQAWEDVRDPRRWFKFRSRVKAS